MAMNIIKLGMLLIIIISLKPNPSYKQVVDFDVRKLHRYQDLVAALAVDFSLAKVYSTTHDVYRK
jgi:hypothetical protein